MSLKFSTALLNAVNNSIAAALLHGAIYIYEGSQPTNANAAPTGTLLGIATVGAGAWTAPGSVTNGLDFAASSAAVLSKSGSETWQFVGLATGTAGWCRFVSGVAADSLALDTSTYPRIDARCGTSGSGAEAILSTLSIVIGATTTIDAYTLNWPSSLYT